LNLPDHRIIRPNAGFIIPTRRFVEAELRPQAVGMSGRYQLIVRDSSGAEKSRTPWFDNIILDSGLNRMGTGAAILGAAIGTGTSTPVSTQTGLDTQSHYTTTPGTGNGANSVAGSSPYNNTGTYVFRTTLGSLNGNYTEVGVGWASGSMFSRALILDGGGSPTSISVSSAEQLDIVYQLSIYPPLVDTSTIVNISGVDYTITGRAASVNATGSTIGWTPITWSAQAVTTNGQAQAFNGTIGAITSTPSGSTGTAPTVAVVGSYSNNSLNRTGRVTHSLTQGNVAGGIKSSTIAWGASGSVAMAGFQYEFNPVLPKDGTKTLTLDYTLTWARSP